MVVHAAEASIEFYKKIGMNIDKSVEEVNKYFPYAECSGNGREMKKQIEELLEEKRNRLSEDYDKSR